MRDALHEGNYSGRIEYQECVETFIVNAKFLGLLRTVAGSERLISIEQLLDELPSSRIIGPTTAPVEAEIPKAIEQSGDWSRVCFVIAPIGADESDWRKHSDLIQAHLVEPAMQELGLTIIRADQIDKPGMITSQIIEHIVHAGLVVADLSFHNPNVFYELALRHATGKPTIHLIRAEDKIPLGPWLRLNGPFKRESRTRSRLRLRQSGTQPICDTTNGLSIRLGSANNSLRWP